MSAEDQNLVLQAQQGNQNALEELYHRYYPIIYTHLFFRVDSPEQAEELTAEVFVRMVEKLHSFTHPQKPLLAWLFTLSGNLLIDHYRKNGRSRAVPLDEMLPDQKDRSISQEVELHFQQQLVTQALRTISEDQRRVIVLRFFYGYNTAEVAGVLQKPESAVKALQHRALAAMRRSLQKEPEIV